MTYDETEPPTIGNMIWVGSKSYRSFENLSYLSRSGNYTDIAFKDSQYIYQIWDEKEILWDAIMELNKKPHF